MSVTKIIQPYRVNVKVFTRIELFVYDRYMPARYEKFANFMEEAFLRFQMSNKQRMTLNDFADHIGVSRPLISIWLSGKQKPGAVTLFRICQLFGPEVYDSLDIPRPDPLVSALLVNWDWLTDEEKETFQNITERAAARHAEGNATT